MKPVYAMAHPGALPGSYLYRGESLESMTDHLLSDVVVYAKHGVTGVILQNMQDLPLDQGIYVEKVAYMTHFGEAIRRQFPQLSLGVMLNWNASAALAVADAVRADFVRVEHTFIGSEIYSSGLFQAQCVEMLRLKKSIGTTIPIFADLYDPYGAPIGKKDIGEACFEAVSFCFADGLFLEGHNADESIHMAIKARASVSVPLYLGGGSTAENVAQLLPYFDALCVGKGIRKDGYLLNPIDENRLDHYLHAVSIASGK